MTQIENWQYKIEQLQKEQRYIQEDIEDLLEKINEEKEADKLFKEL